MTAVQRWMNVSLATLMLAGAGLAITRLAHALPREATVPRTDRADSPAPVPSPPAPTGPDPVQQSLAAFQNSPVPGVWPKLTKSVILDEIRARIRDPFQVNQGP